MTYEPEEKPEVFNPIVEIKNITAALDDEPSEDRHMSVLPLEWLAQEIVRAPGPKVSNEDVRSHAISFLTGDSRPEAYHLLACEPCLNGLLEFIKLYRFPDIPID